MYRISLPPLFFGLLLACGLSGATNPPKREVLTYTINWPSGLSLGETRMSSTAEKGGEGRRISLDIEAALPGFPIRDEYTSRTDAQGCSVIFEKHTQHGSKSADEKLEFDRNARVVKRRTLPEGGSSELQIQGCARDALAYLDHLRKELALGRLPQPQTIYAGGPYKISLQYKATQTLRLGQESFEADLLEAQITGPKARHKVEIGVSKDESRRILFVRIPFDIGAFSMELIP